ALDETRRRLAYLLSATSAIIYSCEITPPFGATFISDNVGPLLGYSAQQFLGEPGFWANRIHPDERDSILREGGRVFDVGRHVHEYRFLHADGTYRWMHDELVLTRDALG